MDAAYLVVIHPPELDLPVVGSTDNERHAGVEVCPVDAPVVALQHVLHHSIRLANEGTVLSRIDQSEDSIYLAKQVRGVGVLLDVVL